jgi:hypothetical protein
VIPMCRRAAGINFSCVVNRRSAVTLLKPNPEEALASMRAVKSVITADGPMVETQRSMMAMAQRYFLQTDHDIDALEPISPDELSRAIVDPALRRQLVQIMCAYVMLGKDIRPEHIDRIRAYAGAFDLSDPAVDHLRYVIEDRIGWLRFDFRRKAAVGDAIKQAYRKEGVRGAFGAVMQITGHGDDPALAARFRALGALPDGTLGRELVRFYQENQFLLPGEPSGTPLPLLTHDLAHLVAGYGTDLLGEVRTLAFQTGFKREKPLMFMFLLLFQIQLGIEMVALAKGVNTLEGFFDQPGVLEEVFKAFGRGSAMSVDLMDGEWDYWSVFDRPLSDLRARYGVPPA